jgi:hypothetical protein
MTVFVPGSYGLRRDSQYECCKINHCASWQELPARSFDHAIDACMATQNSTACLRALFPRPLCLHERPL